MDGLLFLFGFVCVVDGKVDRFGPLHQLGQSAGKRIVIDIGHPSVLVRFEEGFGRVGEVGFQRLDFLKGSPCFVFGIQAFFHALVDRFLQIAQHLERLGANLGHALIHGSGAGKHFLEDGIAVTRLLLCALGHALLIILAVHVNHAGKVERVEAVALGNEQIFVSKKVPDENSE